MKELTVISGKGGTGKTSVTASFATLADNRIVVDADVDAANLFLTLEHKTLENSYFKGGSKACIDKDACIECGDCRERCQFDAISEDFIIDPIACEGCGVCAYFCPEKAIAFEQQVCGEKFVSQTPWGPMIHARLGIAEENSGLLVSQLRQEARELAKDKKIPLIITDGPPGIGCPVIAAVTNADALLIVTEPTLSGLHDMERVKALADQMNIPTMLCINKADLNPETAGRIKNFAEDNGIHFVGEIPFDREVIDAMKASQSLVQFSQGAAAKAVKSIWKEVQQFMGTTLERIM
ncbi:MinD superfamily P-loop ATPase, contains an inserted ferredoxin domain [Desulfocicer vacuolatum DSM 3385]|uniref:MinD superfamily P-loop ATPase, contains an inserted ferredoxin domain n=1 Tax=Desulfocicer vacuolatum DSM 3385 TaxID=1121400 RepID=A0A1W2A5K4_9BACT|nr:ATP-binding protein [Desulfocicer vacuolatum]SMC55930.1 MinD superfamily P-loop ATPase, contains an inserted ferredoxin domain [Desulfocicer vacuolatum DSM 3385]